MRLIQVQAIHTARDGIPFNTMIYIKTAESCLKLTFISEHYLG